LIATARNEPQISQVAQVNSALVCVISEICGSSFFRQTTAPAAVG